MEEFDLNAWRALGPKEKGSFLNKLVKTKYRGTNLDFRSLAQRAMVHPKTNIGLGPALGENQAQPRKETDTPIFAAETPEPPEYILSRRRSWSRAIGKLIEPKKGTTPQKVDKASQLNKEKEDPSTLIGMSHKDIKKHILVSDGSEEPITTAIHEYAHMILNKRMKELDLNLPTWKKELFCGAMEVLDWAHRNPNQDPLKFVHIRNPRSDWMNLDWIDDTIQARELLHTILNQTEDPKTKEMQTAQIRKDLPRLIKEIVFHPEIKKPSHALKYIQGTWKPKTNLHEHYT